MFKFIQNYWLGIVIATVAAMAIGSLWYSKLVFGKEWQKLAKIKDSDMKKGMMTSMVGMLVLAFISAYVLKRFIVIANPSDILGAIKISIWLWLGFVATYAISTALFEKRPAKLVAINISNQLITLIVMAAILFKIN